MNLAAVASALRENPRSFGFFQAVRLLERLRPDRAGVGRFVDPADEVVRFSANPSIAFPPSEIEELEVADEGDDSPGRMSVNFLGLTGPSGVLPYHYTLLVADRVRARDGALAAFLDLFHHRILSLFYRAWSKHQFAIALEKGETDPLAEHLRDLVGIGLDSARARLPVAEEATLGYYAGLFAPQQRSAVALEHLLSDHFDVPVEVEQFVGGWFPLPRRDRCALGEDEGDSDRLGFGAVAGDEVWDPQARIRIRIGPLAKEQYDAFLPSGSAHEPLRALTRFFCHDQFEVEVQLVLRRDEVPGFVLGADQQGSQPLGWSTWLRSRPFPRDADDTIFRL